MKVKIDRVPKEKMMSITEFADQYNLTLQVIERDGKCFCGVFTENDRWCVYLVGVDVVGDGVLISESGSGDTPHSAAADYCRELSGKKIQLPDDSRMTCPQLFNEWMME